MAEPIICAGCALLCDDASAEVTGGAAVLTPECELGASWLSGRIATAPPAATIDGEPASVAAALERAVELLRSARRPLLYGFAEATTEDARSAVALADRIGAMITTLAVADRWSGATALGLRGTATASLGEIRDRAQLVVVWREDPEATHPRLLDRLGFGPEPSASRRQSARTLVVIDDRDTATARRADVRLSWPADRDLEALRGLLARLRGHAGGGEEPLGPGIPELIGAADHTAFVYGDGLTAGSGGERRALALHDYVRALNGERRAVTLALPSAPGSRGANDVLTWQTGYSGTVDLASGHPEPAGLTRARLAEEGIDVAVSVQGRPGPALPGVAEIALSAQPVSGVAVSLATAAAGVARAGTAHRLDGVPLTLHAPLPTDAPAAATLLDRLRVELAR